MASRTIQTTDFDDYWQREEHVARLPIPPQDFEQDLFFLWHQSRERYGKDHHEIGVTLRGAGQREYVHVKACYYLPRIILTVGLTPPVQTEIGKETGEVLDSRREGSDRHFIASLQAWYYPVEKTLMLWEVDIFGPYSSEDPSEGFLLAVLWQRLERELLKRFTDSEQIVTPGWEPKYSGEQWRSFLTAQGYMPHVDNTFIKHISHTVGDELGQGSGRSR